MTFFVSKSNKFAPLLDFFWNLALGPTFSAVIFRSKDSSFYRTTIEFIVLPSFARNQIKFDVMIKYTNKNVKNMMKRAHTATQGSIFRKFRLWTNFFSPFIIVWWKGHHHFIRLDERYKIMPKLPIKTLEIYSAYSA